MIASRYPLSVAGSIRFSQVLYEQLLVGPSSLEDALLVVVAAWQRTQVSSTGPVYSSMRGRKMAMTPAL